MRLMTKYQFLNTGYPVFKAETQEQTKNDLSDVRNSKARPELNGQIMEENIKKKSHFSFCFTHGNSHRSDLAPFI